MDQRAADEILSVCLTCAGLGIFAATAVTSILAASIRKKLGLALLVEIVILSFGVFSGALADPRAVAARVAALEKDRTGLAVGVEILKATVTAEKKPPDFGGIQRTMQKASSLSLRRSSVLWVEDSAEDSQYEQNALRQVGVEIVFAPTSAAALDELSSRDFAAIVTDFARADDSMAAYTLLDAVNKREKAPPIIIYSLSATPEQVQQAKQRGALDEATSPNEVVDQVLSALLARQ